MWKSALILALVLASYRLARAENMADQILLASHEDVTSHSVEMRQTVEQNAQIMLDGKPIGPPQKTSQNSTIEVDARNKLVRMTSRDGSGTDMVILRKGKNVAMKIGSGPWAPPTGAYSQIGDQLGNPFACPLPKQGAKDAPRWTLVGSERLDGTETTVIETVGNSACAYAAERMRDGVASVFPEPKTRPTIEVLAYKARHWIDARNDHRLRVEQTSHVKMAIPGTGNTIIDSQGKITTVYTRYDDVVIEVPQEACRILDPR